MTSMQNDRPRAFAIGHSHLTALQQGYQDWMASGETGGVELVFAQLLQDKFKPEVVEGQLGGAVAEALNAESWDAVVSVVGGNLYNWLGFTEHPRRLDIISPDAPDAPLSEGAEIVPASAVRKRMLSELDRNFDLLKGVRAATTAPMFHMESPPPIPSEEHIRKYPRVFETALQSRALTPALIRWKLWRLQSGLFREFCDANDIEFVAAPSDMMDSDGMLAELAWPFEPTHANRVYGKRQIRQIEERLARFAQ